MAKASDTRRARGEAGLLEGVHARHQGSVLHRGRADHGASHILEGFVPQ